MVSKQDDMFDEDVWDGSTNPGGGVLMSAASRGARFPCPDLAVCSMLYLLVTIVVFCDLHWT